MTPTSATVSVRLVSSGLRVRLALGTNESLANIRYYGDMTTADARGNVAVLDAAGLQPNTEYFYAFEVQGVLRTDGNSRGRFRTFPAGADSFKIAFASCSDYRDPDQRAFGAIMAEQPLLFIQTGDLHYRDTNTTNVADHLHDYDEVLNSGTESALYRSMAIAHIWDDHDFCGDNSDGTAIGRTAAQAAFEMRVPHYPFAVTDGTVGQAFTVGRVRFIMTDTRSASAQASLAESAGKTRLGAMQKAWFKQQLLSARDAAFPLIVWVCSDPWIDAPVVGSDAWGGYATERAEIANFIRDNRIKNLVIMAGDMHALAYDDGTHSDYATGGGAPLVVLQAAALTREGNVKGGPYTAGPFLGSPNYGVFEVTDNGGQSISCRFTGKRVSEGVKLTLQFTANVNAIDRSPPVGTPGAVDRALVNISARGRIASPGDTLIAGFVIEGKSSRNILLRAVGPALLFFGISDAVKRPAFVLFNDKGAVVASNSDWRLADQARLTAAFDRAGAFRFPVNSASQDAALFLTLPPGAYTLQAGSATNETGSILTEVYEVP